MPDRPRTGRRSGPVRFPGAAPPYRRDRLPHKRRRRRKARHAEGRLPWPHLGIEPRWGKLRRKAAGGTGGRRAVGPPPRSPSWSHEGAPPRCQSGLRDRPRTLPRRPGSHCTGRLERQSVAWQNHLVQEIFCILPEPTTPVKSELVCRRCAAHAAAQAGQPRHHAPGTDATRRPGDILAGSPAATVHEEASGSVTRILQIGG
jgi:hypothetical protein